MSRDVLGRMREPGVTDWLATEQLPRIPTRWLVPPVSERPAAAPFSAFDLPPAGPFPVKLAAPASPLPPDLPLGWLAHPVKLGGALFSPRGRTPFRTSLELILTCGEWSTVTVAEACWLLGLQRQMNN